MAVGSALISRESAQLGVARLPVTSLGHDPGSTRVHPR